ncbi:MAG: hypothetical protein DME72_06900 [Verrucomicrobia bacterium]|nr:MAG: hypothetical protein DME72_06900 [Verrucomicrobiota bacterium]
MILPEPRRGWRGIDALMPNVEARITNEDRIYESRKSRLTLFHASDFVIPSSLDIRHSSFRQRHIRHAS